jgi:hypothetical protein
VSGPKAAHVPKAVSAPKAAQAVRENVDM